MIGVSENDLCSTTGAGSGINFLTFGVILLTFRIASSGSESQLPDCDYSTEQNVTKYEVSRRSCYFSIAGNIKMAQELNEKMAFERIVPLNVAYHSKLMESASVGFEKISQNNDFNARRVEF
jgi:hypothetical protein